MKKHLKKKGPARAGPFCLLVDLYRPTVVAQVDVGSDLIGIDDHLLDLFVSFVEVGPGISTMQDFYGNDDPLGGIFCGSDLKGNRN